MSSDDSGTHEMEQVVMGGGREPSSDAHSGGSCQNDAARLGASVATSSRPVARACANAPAASGRYQPIHGLMSQI